MDRANQRWVMFDDTMRVLRQYGMQAVFTLLGIILIVQAFQNDKWFGCLLGFADLILLVPSKLPIRQRIRWAK